MNICILGNSHVGALKYAWDSMSTKHPELSVDFFAARGSSLEGLSISGKSLVPDNEPLRRMLSYTSKGKVSITPSEYDYIFLYGLNLRPMIIDGTAFYSDAVLQQTAEDVVDGSLGLNILKMLNRVSEVPVFLGHNPFPAFVGEFEKDGDLKNYKDGVKFLNYHVYSPIGACMLIQPEETITNRYYTKSKFSKGSKRLSVGDKIDGELHPESDSSHMNEEFGRCWMNELLKKLT